MEYLKLKRSQIILGCFLLSSLLLVQFPRIDIGISQLFFEQDFYLKDRWWQTLQHGATGYLLGASMLVVTGIYVFNRCAKRTVAGIDGKRVAYLFLVLIIGAGLIVNVAFKDQFGRARPRDIVEFGGTKNFAPAFVIGNECKRNCSFSSGEGAAGFFALALAMALSKRRRMLLLAFGFGCVVAMCRISAGAHFFSDNVVSFFVMLIVADVLFYYMIVRTSGSHKNGSDQREKAIPVHQAG